VNIHAKSKDNLDAHLALLDPFQQRANIPLKRVWEFIK